MKKDDFFEKYKDPRWQKKRLEKMKDADFSCEMCGDKESTLNVHHKYYIQGNEPWQYDDISLVVLCEDCHNQEHESKENFELMLRKMKEYFNFYELTCILDGIIGEFENIGENDCMYVKSDCIVRGIKSGLLIKIGESLVGQILETRSAVKKEYKIEQ